MSHQDVVVITGASSGVGRATAVEFARHGARIGLIARGIDGLEAALRDIKAVGGDGLVLPCDVANADVVEAAADRDEQELGPIGVWVNNAMVSVFSPVAQMQPDEYRRVTEVNYLGTVHGTLAALGRMTRRNAGTIIQIGSALAYRSIPLQSAYCATKHAIAGFTDSLRCELLHDQSGIKLTMIDLPAINTPHFDVARSRLPRKAQPVPPIYQPEVAARAIHHAAYHHRRQWFIGAPTVTAIAGQVLVPGLLDRYLADSGYDSQLREESEDPHRQDNLWNPLPGDRGVRGSFDSQSQSRSLQVWADQHRLALTVTALAAAGGVLAAAGTWARARRFR